MACFLATEQAVQGGELAGRRVLKQLHHYVSRILNLGVGCSSGFLIVFESRGYRYKWLVAAMMLPHFSRHGLASSRGLAAARTRRSPTCVLEADYHISSYAFSVLRSVIRALQVRELII